MKYIRTKDGRIIDLTTLSNLDINDRGDIVWYNDTEKYGYMIEYKNIIKVADTIEELCDEFVRLRLKDELNDNEPIIFKYLDLAKSYFEKYLGYAIYGAIWTDKGLIYVAKMNDKGVLELL